MITFSHNSKLLATLGEDKTIAVTDWLSQSVLVNVMTDGVNIHHMTFLSTIHSTDNVKNLSSVINDGSISFITTGDKVVKVWSLSGRNLSNTKTTTSFYNCVDTNTNSISSNSGASPTGSIKSQNFLCVVNIYGKILIGGEDGYIYLSLDSGRSIQSRFHHQDTSDPFVKAVSSATAKAGSKASAGDSQTASVFPAVTSMAFNDKSNLLVTGYKNGEVRIWNCAELIHSSFQLSVLTAVVESSTTGKASGGTGSGATSKAPSTATKNFKTAAVTLASTSVSSSTAPTSVTATGTKIDRKLSQILPVLIAQFKLEDIKGLDAYSLNTFQASSKQIQSVNVSSFSEASTATRGSNTAGSTEAVIVTIGTRGCDLLQVKCDISLNSEPTSTPSVELYDKSGEISHGHYNDELWGLAMHPFLPEYATTGEISLPSLFQPFNMVYLI